MKTLTKQLFLLLGLVLTVSMQAQVTVKPDASTIPAKPGNSPVLPTVTHSGTQKVNYVRSFDFYAPYTSMPTGGTFTTAITDGKLMQATQYMDGLGRPIQTVARKASGQGHDLVTFMVYDEYGRPTFQPMPYVATGSSNGSMQLTPSASQNSFLTGQYTGEEVFFTYTDFEASPLNRTLKVTGPGNSWTAHNKSVSTDYLTNTSAEGVRYWTVAATPTSTAYQAGELSKVVTEDENGNKVKEYTNPRGQVVLKQVQKANSTAEAHSHWLNTYYLYDDYGNLRHVLPPRAVELLYSSGNNWNWNNADIDELIFSYTYDGRNRMITKKVPGAGVVSMVYDKLDRLVLTQDANQDAINQWTYTKYDAQGRPAMTGFITDAAIRDTLQATADGWTGEMHVLKEGLVTAGALEAVSITVSHRDTSIGIYRAKNTGKVVFLPGTTSEDGANFETHLNPNLSSEYVHIQGYHDATFPQLTSYLNNFELNTINYYDDYDFTDKSWSTDYNGFDPAEGANNAVSPQQHSNVKGLATGSKVRILGSSDYLTTVMFYDDRGRVIQTQADNHLGGEDISTTQYDFAGRVLHTYTKHSNPQSSSASTRILKEFEYDHAGRLLSIKEKLNDTGSLKTLVTNSYNELGELESKKLGDANAPLETLDYEYNIRGWLKSINGDYVAGTTSNRFFGMDLSYDHGFSHNQYNGNIAGVKWKSKSTDETRAYGFEYDPVNRLTAADYTQGTNWTNTVADFSTSYGYDANGNILSLTREGMIAGTKVTLDDLTYDYVSVDQSKGPGNQLFKVADSEGDQGQGDFKDGNSSGDDYEYDANGNMKDDLNKGITNITYNHLNLPKVVSFGSNKTITYTYDASGIKLSKVVNDNGSITTTDYIGGFIYENNALQHFAHEEGRTRIEGGKNKYDYFVKDHLGNTRMTLTEARDSVVYLATMEDANDTYEEQVFLNIAETRDGTGGGNYAPGGSKSARLNPNEEIIGPAKMLVVSALDTIDIEVFAKYPSTFNSTISGDDTAIAAALATVFGATGAGASTYEQGVYNGLNNNAGSFLGSVLGSGSSTVPKAYLNYVFFDQDFNFIASSSSYKQVSTAAEDDHELLEFNGLVMPEGGYLFVYVSNEGHSTTGGNVYFDDLRITHKNGPIIQEDHYYPFGGTISTLSSSAPLSKPNNFKVQSKELQTEFDLDWFDFEARFYDPQIARTTTHDPHADSYLTLSPYSWVANNPMLIIDPTGKDIVTSSSNITLEGWKAREFQMNYSSMTGTNGSDGNCPEGNCDEKGENKAESKEAIIKGDVKNPVNLPGMPVTNNNLDLAQAKAAHEAGVTLLYTLVLFDAFLDTNFSGTNNKGHYNEETGVWELEAKVPIVSVTRLPKLIRSVKQLKQVRNSYKRIVVIGEDMNNRVIPFAQKYGLQFYKPRNLLQPNLGKNNIRWFRKAIKDPNTLIYDLGPAGKKPVRDAYINELAEYLKSLK